MIVLSTIRYGETIYGSASKSALRKIEPVHHKRVKIALGVFAICKIENALCETHRNEGTQYNNGSNENPHK
jgi:hypothetical protein